MEIDHAQIVGQVMADIKATNDEEIGGQGMEEATQEHLTPPVSLLPLNLLIFVAFDLK